MLYQTPPLLFNPFTSSSNSISSSLQVVEMGMESVEGAMKSSLRPELGLKVSQNYVHFQQASSEDLFGGNGQQQAEDFSVDDLLDFSNDLVQPLYEEEQKTEPQPEKLQQQNNVCSTQNYDKPSANSSLIDDFEPLSVPVDDLESLEWLSHFVEDSFCEYSLTCPPGKPAPVVKKEHIRSEPGAGPEVAVNESTVFTTPVQTKARTKRSRSGLRVWSLGAASFTEHSSSSSTSSTSASENGNYSPWGVCQSQTGELAEPAGLKRKRMTGNGLGGTPQPRRCSHCGVQKTPQWRAGPLGAKTLCNACGVRFKSGRLFPEYRPACSPTFSSELHSNNHRKVLEMRRKKDGETELALPG